MGREAKEIAEAMAAEGVEPELIKRVLLNLGFSREEALRAVARACIVVGRGEDHASQGPRKVEASTVLKREEASSSTVGVRELEMLQRKVTVLEGRVTALIDLLSEYVPAIIEKVRAREPYNGGVRSHL